MMEKPMVAQSVPIAVEVEAGKTYWWCACGRSSKQPFCDGSHKDTGFAPQRYEAADSRRVFFCACKQSDRAPVCDGSHKKL
ncbi:CDGSH iron-sulfur domain-containing protein [Exilibacterium tricleocarpae]|uniref:CDGSH iron-sulfur domain-containing protein n=1 Tax=Exilibacterium tricleocarpae TaxID=2591008 RepID=A0A545U5L4_9GAMM|nr:CDGSH iron-sulfur domain-containing protein [Exilibacterium tricleocarpae]TQV84765.1 CDGSH iron-sulfur domain-containing protein [Exilibacterium tricleocarpae]